MSSIQTEWRSSLLEQLAKAGILVSMSGAGIEQWLIGPDDWHRFAELAHHAQLRWAAGWAEQQQQSYWVNSCFAHQNQYLWLRTSLAGEKPELPSQSVIYPAASRSERHTQDMFGINFTDHPDSRPWTRHQAWAKNQYPLQKDFSLQGQPPEITAADTDYVFVKARGAGVYEIPVGPVHAGIIEPGHFRFQAVGETVLHLEERLGYTHKGIEKLAEGRTPAELARLAGRISGDSTVAHSWAACRAMEQAAGVTIPPRADFIRGILCERERIANHLGDIGAICNDVGFAFAQMQFSRLREIWQRRQAEIFGHRLLMDCVLPGGVKSDLSAQHCALVLKDIQVIRAELNALIPALDLNSSLEDRLLTTGFLATERAVCFGALGYVGRASGMDIDVRRDAPYPPYDRIPVKVIVENQGDVASRFWIRIKEVFASLKLIEKFVQQLPESDIISPWQQAAEHSEGLAMIEGWRGEIISYVRFGGDNTISRFYSRDPSAINWLTLEALILKNIVPDFPVCNKSVNGSYSGHDL